jgi:hypothetical protein
MFPVQLHACLPHAPIYEQHARRATGTILGHLGCALQITPSSKQPCVTVPASGVWVRRKAGVETWEGLTTLAAGALCGAPHTA